MKSVVWAIADTALAPANRNFAPNDFILSGENPLEFDGISLSIARARKGPKIKGLHVENGWSEREPNG